MNVFSLSITVWMVLLLPCPWERVRPVGRSCGRLPLSLSMLPELPELPAEGLQAPEPQRPVSERRRGRAGDWLWVPQSSRALRLFPFL